MNPSEVLRYAEWRREVEGLLEDYCRLDAKKERLYIRACGRTFPALLRGCTEELKVTLRLSYLAEAL
ncbi:MAG: hypothetical protein QXH81_10830 [Thermofilaceae archaeon]